MAKKADRILITWPAKDSQPTELKDLPANQVVYVKEGQGIVKTEPLKR